MSLRQTLRPANLSGMLAALCLLLAAIAQADQTATPQRSLSSMTDLGVFQQQQPPPGAIWLDSLDLSRCEQGFGQPQMGRSFHGHPITLNGLEFPHGVGTHAVSNIKLDLSGQATRFASAVGIDDEVTSYAVLIFNVYVDDVLKATSGRVRRGQQPQVLEVDLTGAQTLRLLVDVTIAHDNSYAHVDWAGAFIELLPGATRMPKAIMIALEPTDPIAPADLETTAIHAPRVTGATPGCPFMFRIPASGRPPLVYEAQGLPEGLSLDAHTGVISGSLEHAGTTVATLKVSGPGGRAQNQLTIVGGYHKLAQTPPMAWNSWFAVGAQVEDADVRQAADAMVQSGLIGFGYQYICIDDGWQGGRDADGEIFCNERFPDMKGLIDYVHAKGLKFGLYSSPGPKTCAGYEGSFGHEFQDARTYAQWGVDFLKYDLCSYYTMINDPKSVDEMKKPYVLMREALDACGRDIVYSLCQYGLNDVWEWGEEIGANLWRTTYDIGDNWPIVAKFGFDSNALHAAYAGPGHWNDSEMLMIGNRGKGPTPGPGALLPNEVIAHMSLWCLASSPLLLSCRLDHLTSFTLDVLTNPEVLAVNQDPLGRQAQCVQRSDGMEVWARPLADGTQAVGVFNRNLNRAPMNLEWSVLGLEGPQPVRDLWQRKDLGELNGFPTQVSAHGVVLLKVGRPHAKEN